MGLFESVPQCPHFFAMLLLDASDLAGRREDESALLVGWRRRCGDRTGLGSQTFDASGQVRVVIEESVRDVGLALDGLESDRLAAFDQAAAPSPCPGQPPCPRR